MKILFRALQVIGWLFVIAASTVTIFVMLRTSAPGEHPVVEYKDFVSILLTALGVMIALAAVVAAGAAVWGFEFLRKEMVQTSAATATRIATARVDEIVPGLVEKVLDVDREVSGTKADQIAQEFAKDGGSQ